MAARLKVVTKLEQGRRSVTAASTWPNSPKIIESQFKGVPNPIKQKLIWENCAKFYGVG